MLDQWTQAVAAELGLEPEVDRDLVLDLARDAAHGVARPAAPLTTFLLGYAAGRSDADAEQLRAAADRIAALANNWHEDSNGSGAGGAESETGGGDGGSEDAKNG